VTLHVRQRSASHGFAYDVRDDAGTVVGHLDWPWLAQARNARLKWHGDDARPGEIRVRVDGAEAHVGWTHLRRGTTNDVRFELTGPDGPRAVLDVLVRPRQRRHALEVRAPFAGAMLRDGRIGRARYLVQDGERTIGVVEEPRLFTWVRELRVELPASLDRDQQLFFAVMALHDLA
jgi:hypothetical protein